MLRGSGKKLLLLLSLKWKLIRLLQEGNDEKIRCAAEWGSASARETGLPLLMSCNQRLLPAKKQPLPLSLIQGRLLSLLQALNLRGAREVRRKQRQQQEHLKSITIVSQSICLFVSLSLYLYSLPSLSLSLSLSLYPSFYLTLSHSPSLPPSLSLSLYLYLSI